MSSSLTTKRRKVSSGSYTLKTTRSEPFHTGFRPLSPAGGRNAQRFNLWDLSPLSQKSPEAQAEKSKSSRRAAAKAEGARALIISRFYIIIIFCGRQALPGRPAFCPVRGGIGSSPPRPRIFPLWDPKPHKDEAHLIVDIDTQQTQSY